VIQQSTSDVWLDLVDLLQDASQFQPCRRHCLSHHEQLMSLAAEPVAPNDNKHIGDNFNALGTVTQTPTVSHHKPHLFQFFLIIFLLMHHYADFGHFFLRVLSNCSIIFFFAKFLTQ